MTKSIRTIAEIADMSKCDDRDEFVECLRLIEALKTALLAKHARELAAFEARLV